MLEHGLCLGNTMRRLACLIFMLPLAAHGAQQPAAPARDELVRRWLAENVGAPIIIDPGCVIEWSLERRSQLDATDVQRRLKELEPYPDHPERRSLEQHQQLLLQPEQLDATIWFSGPGLWACRERQSSGTSFECGGLDATRWMLFRIAESGQLTVIRAGQPFPTSYNVSRYSDLTRERVATLLYGGLPNLPRAAIVRSVAATNSRWEATLVDEIGHRVFNLMGEWAPGDRPLVRSLHVAAEDPTNSAAAVTVTTFDALNITEPSLPPWPAQVIVYRPDGIVETYTVRSVRRAERSELEQAASVPAVSNGVQLVDFRDPESPSWAAYPDAPRMTWYRKGDADHFEVDPAAVGRPTSGSIPQAAQYWRALAATLCVLVLIGIPAALRRRQLKKEVF